jgi:SOS-response transcriptional repressor LexA
MQQEISKKSATRNQQEIGISSKKSARNQDMQQGIMMCMQKIRKESGYAARNHDVRPRNQDMQQGITTQAEEIRTCSKESRYA